MPLVTMKSLLDDAERGGYAVGAFNVANLEMIMGAIRAAEEFSSPIILQIAEIRLPHSPLALIGPAMVAAAKRAKVPVAVNLDHGMTLECIREALGLGFTSVMFDGSRLPISENICLTGQVRKMAERYGATTEAEIGVIHPGSESVAEYTNPEEAASFWRAVQVDALAVAIGNAHGLYHVEPHLRFDVLNQIGGKVPVPLVLHGGTGISETDFKKGIQFGIRKINVATATFNSVEYAVQDLCRKRPEAGYFDLQEAEIGGAYENIKRHIMMFGSAGRAKMGSLRKKGQEANQ